jgi:hypothetical protein
MTRYLLLGVLLEVIATALLLLLVGLLILLLIASEAFLVVALLVLLGSVESLVLWAVAFLAG